MNTSYNVMLLTEAFKMLRRAKSMEIEAIKMAHRAEINDLIERNGDKCSEDIPEGRACNKSTIDEPKDDALDLSLGSIGERISKY